jgi:hypothetical protein
MTPGNFYDPPARTAGCDADTAARQRRARLAALPDAELLRLTALALRLEHVLDPVALPAIDGEAVRALAEAQMAADRRRRNNRQWRLRLAAVLALVLMAAALILWLVWS